MVIGQRTFWGRQPLASSALALAASGLPVFPCSTDKKPIVEGGFKNATRDPETIRAMFVKPGAALIGVPTGRASGRVVIDVDPRHNGDAWLRENQNRLPSTLTHRTPGGGEHLAFRDPPDVEIRNSQGRIAPGVDVRGTGGYVIVPPSEGYTIKHNGALADMPQWLIKASLKPDRPPPQPSLPSPPPNSGHGSPYGLKALSEECTAIQHAPFGQQEMMLNNAALKIGSLVASGELLEGYALSELITAGNAMASENGRDPWRPAEIEKKVRHAFDDGKRTPRQVPPPRANISRISVDTRAKARPNEEPPPLGVGPSPQLSGPNGDGASARPPTITVTAGELHILATKAESVLIAAGAEIFQRGVLVRPAVIELPASDNRKTQAAVLAEVTRPGMIDELSRVAR